MRTITSSGAGSAKRAFRTVQALFHHLEMTAQMFFDQGFFFEAAVRSEEFFFSSGFRVRIKCNIIIVQTRKIVKMRIIEAIPPGPFADRKGLT